jgi:hypothetical protein
MKGLPPWAQNIIFVHNFAKFPNSPKDTKTIKRNFTSNYILDSATHKFRTLPNRQCYFIHRNYTLFTHDFLQHSRLIFFLIWTVSRRTSRCGCGKTDTLKCVAIHHQNEERAGENSWGYSVFQEQLRLKGTIKGNGWRNYSSKNSTSDNIPAYSLLQNVSNSDVLSQNVI